MRTEYAKFFIHLKLARQSEVNTGGWFHYFLSFELDVYLSCYYCHNGLAFCELKDQSLLVLKFPSVLKKK